MKKTVLGIIAHVDSGKTTLSEAMLFDTGTIRNLGRVDHKNAFLDTNEIERERGITIFSKQAMFKINETEITLLDTPGHVDFSPETERTLEVLDYAVLVISGTDGVQSHTETLWKLLKRYNVPTFVFVNKMDIASKTQEELILELAEKFGGGFVDFTEKGEDTFLENLAMCDEKLMHKFFEDETVSEADIADATARRKVFPCYFGSALKCDGVSEFLNGIDKFTKPAEIKNDFGAKIYKITEEAGSPRLTLMKITGGSLKVKSTVNMKNENGEEISEKINQIRVYSGTKFTAVDEAVQGMVCAVAGLSKTYSGQGLGFEADAKKPSLEPVLSYGVIIKDGTDINRVYTALKQLQQEEPGLHTEYRNGQREITIRLMGEIQLEILKRLVFERFKINIEFGHGKIAYKETISAPVQGMGHYEPLRHYAEVRLLLSPGEKGSGITFDTACSEDVLDKNWQRLIYTHVKEKTHIGVLTGSPITDIKITLLGGRAHLKHTEGGDFRQATYRAIRQGLMNAQSVLLEPWYDFELCIPSETVGRAMTDLQQMDAKMMSPQPIGEMSVIEGSAPVAKMRGYHTDVLSYTGGRGRLSCSLKGYEPCTNAQEIIAARNYNPEADIDNTPDSVFCAHGAGFTVKWDKVGDYMHTDVNLQGEEKEYDEQTAAEESKRRAAEYLDRVATDKELMEIFEKTYGPIKRHVHTAMHTEKSLKKEEKPHKIKPKQQLSGPEYLLVDGYNVIFSWEKLNKLSKQSLDLARSQLADILCNYKGFCKCEVILVFDAYKVKGNRGEVEKYHNISIVYTKEAETADMYIEKVTHELAKTRRVRVVTSDNVEQLIILGGGALRVSAREFEKEVAEIEQSIREFVE